MSKTEEFDPVPDHKRIVLKYYDVDVCEVVGGWGFTNTRGKPEVFHRVFNSSAAAWFAASEYTQQQAYAIRKRENDLEWIKVAQHIPGDVAYNRIVALIRASLNELRKGMKP